MQAGAKKVVLCVPAKDEIDATIVIGVNDEDLKPEHRIVSNASCTTNCLAPVAKILDDAFGIEEGFITTVHAYTNDQRLADVPHKDPAPEPRGGREHHSHHHGRRSRGGQGDAAAQGQAGRHGHARPGARRLDRRPGLPAGQEARRREDDQRRVKETAEGPMKSVVEYSEAPLVSSDIIGNPHSSIFDARSTAVAGRRLRARSSPGTTTSGVTPTAWSI